MRCYGSNSKIYENCSNSTDRWFGRNRASSEEKFNKNTKLSTSRRNNAWKIFSGKWKETKWKQIAELNFSGIHINSYFIDGSAGRVRRACAKESSTRMAEIRIRCDLCNCIARHWIWVIRRTIYGRKWFPSIIGSPFHWLSHTIISGMGTVSGRGIRNFAGSSPARHECLWVATCQNLRPLAAVRVFLFYENKTEKK